MPTYPPSHTPPTPPSSPPLPTTTTTDSNTTCAPLRPGRWVYEKGSRKPCGVDVERLSASAPLRGSLRRPLAVPFRSSPFSCGALRSAGVPTIAARSTSAPVLPGHIRSDARGYPICDEGWAIWVFGGSHTCSKLPGVFDSPPLRPGAETSTALGGGGSSRTTPPAARRPQRAGPR